MEESDCEGELVFAKRNLELAELNFQIENEIKQINENHYEQIEHLDSLTTNLHNFKTGLNESRIIALTNSIKHIAYPRLRLFFD